MRRSRDRADEQSFCLLINQKYWNDVVLAGVVGGGVAIVPVGIVFALPSATYILLARSECTQSESEIFLRYHRDHSYYVSPGS